MPSRTRRTLFLLLGFMPAIARAGMFPTTLVSAQSEPACLQLEAGGIIGSGLNVTVTNGCARPVTISSVRQGSDPQHLQPMPNYIGWLIQNQMTRPFESGADGRDCVFANAITVDHTAPVCRSLTLAPGEGAVIAVNGHFSMQGPNGVLVRGETQRVFYDAPTDGTPIGGAPDNALPVPGSAPR